MISNTQTPYQYIASAPLHLQYHQPPNPPAITSLSSAPPNTTLTSPPPANSLPPGHQFVSYPQPPSQSQDYYLIPNPMTSIAPWNNLVTTQSSHGPV